ncbi:hypothetical protein MHO82_10025 [Vibrio sp. Of7-15]|uniref:hypothetical protein n=1 Tax=Vibrio sp. Of7-15 TaxID=2724879 RepID=UPI001EF3C11D|nr:hypothetical protein [Vibrio sp. Of7-15]MCG7497205.1 hypothetical protein [Vibrio sp. Of7-15]
MTKKSKTKKRKHTNGYRNPWDYAHLSSNAQHRLLYTKRKTNNAKEEKILKRVQKVGGYKLLFGYYIIGVSSFMTWAAFGRLSLILGLVGMAYVFYRYIRMTWSIEERLTYEREYPVKTVTEVYEELVRDGVLTSSCSVALTLLMFFVMKVVGL